MGADAKGTRELPGTRPAPEDPARADVPDEQNEEVSNVWVAVGVVVLLAVQWGGDRVVEALIDDPSWLERIAVMAAVEVPILVIALKLFLRRRVRQEGSGA